MSAAPIALMGAGTGMGVAGNLIQGQNEMKQANAQANADMVNAKYVKANAIEQAKITAERGQNLLASQRAGFAASGIRMDSDVVGVVQGKTFEDLTKDIGFTLQRGRQQWASLSQDARNAIAQGKAARQQADFNAVGAGLSGGSKMAYMGYQMGQDQTMNQQRNDYLSIMRQNIGTQQGPTGMGW